MFCSKYDTMKQHWKVTGSSSVRICKHRACSVWTRWWGHAICCSVVATSSMWWNGCGWSHVALFQSPSPFPLHPPTQLQLPGFHHHHPFSFLRFSSQLCARAEVLFIFLISLTHNSPAPPPPRPAAALLSPQPPAHTPLAPDLKHTPGPTVKQSDGPDQTCVLNYNPSE